MYEEHAYKMPIIRSLRVLAILCTLEARGRDVGCNIHLELPGRVH
jgi:hypothetical protein